MSDITAIVAKLEAIERRLEKLDGIERAQEALSRNWEERARREEQHEVRQMAEFARLLERQSRIEKRLERLEAIEHALEELAERQTRLETRLKVDEFRQREGAIGFGRQRMAAFRRLLGSSREEPVDVPRFWS